MKKINLFPALQMTSACNKRCEACLRPPDEKDHKITMADFGKYTDDLRRVSATRDIKYQFATGGEPTLWRDGGMDITDVLASFHNLGFIEVISMPTNGMRFEDLNYTREFIQKLSAKITRPVVIGVSVAKYQENLWNSGCAAIDNLLSVCGRPGTMAYPVALVTLSAEDDTYERLNRLYPDLYKRVTALAPLGMAMKSVKECPSLSLKGNDKSALGSFLPHYMKDVMSKLGISEGEFSSMPNSDIIDRLSLFNNCGDSPFIDDRWRYCLPYRADSRFDLCGIGSMEKNTIDDFLGQKKMLDEMRVSGIISFVKKHITRLKHETMDRLDPVFSGDIPVSVAYRGCMLCGKLGEIGVIDELVLSEN
jgi:hypothetical protein